MSATLAAFLDAYADALRRHLADPEGDGLVEGHELGRRALVEGISLLDLTEHHFRVVKQVQTEAAVPAGAVEAGAGSDGPLTEHALEFLLQTLITLDVATRGYLDGTRRYEQQRSRADDLAGRDEFRTALVESLQDGFFVADARGTLIEVNKAFGELTGYGATGVPYPLPHPWAIPEGPRYPDLGTEASRFVVPIQHRDGRRRWIGVSTSALVKPDGEEHIFVGTVRDVTAEHDAQARDQAANRLATALASATTVAEVLEVGLDELRRTVAAETAVVAVWPGHGAPEVYISGTPPSGAQETDTDAPRLEPATEAILKRARLRPGRTLLAVPEGGADSAEGIVAPLGETGDTALWLRFPVPRVVDAADWTLFSLLIGHLSLAVQRARNFDQARSTSLTLQRAMLGPIELPPRFSVHYEPALPPLEIGGDWYDVVPLPDGTIGVVVGDCVGRGLSAAVVMGQLRTAARALLLRGAGPAQLLTELDPVAARIPGALCTTVCAAVLDPVRGLVRYSNAGHMPPILADVDKTGRLLEGGRSVPLATFETPRRPEATTPLPPGSTLVLFTDGLVERRGEDIDEGFAKIAAILADTAEKLPREVADSVLSALRPDGGYDDDIAMVVYRQPPAPLRLDVPARPDRLAMLRRTLTAWLSAAAVPHNLTSDLVAATNEACSNSIEHAYRQGGDDTERVVLTAECVGDQVVIETTDTGTWRPRPADPGPRGRGIDMMRALTEELEIDHPGPGTRVRMSVTLPAITFPVASALRATFNRSGGNAMQRDRGTHGRL